MNAARDGIYRNPQAGLLQGGGTVARLPMGLELGLCAKALSTCHVQATVKTAFLACFIGSRLIFKEIQVDLPDRVR